MDEQQMQQQIVALVQAAMQGDQQAQQQVQQIMQAAQQGDQQAMQIAQMIQAVAQQMQGQQAQMAKFGAKLNYIKFLKGQCPEGYEMQMFKQGGHICKKCMKKAQQGTQIQPQYKDEIEEFKCGRKMKKKACGGNIKKAQQGTDLILETAKRIKLPQHIQDIGTLNKQVENLRLNRGPKNIIGESSNKFDTDNTQLPNINAEGVYTPSNMKPVSTGPITMREMLRKPQQIR